jgi:hypothetical protein
MIFVALLKLKSLLHNRVGFLISKKTKSKKKEILNDDIN